MNNLDWISGTSMCVMSCMGNDEKGFGLLVRVSDENKIDK